MGTHRWEDIKRKKLPDATIERLDREVQAEVTEMNLRALREAAGKTQTEVAALTEMTQSELSKLERRDDHLLSTLRRYVEGLGGELEISAVINGKRINLVGV